MEFWEGHEWNTEGEVDNLIVGWIRKNSSVDWSDRCVGLLSEVEWTLIKAPVISSEKDGGIKGVCVCVFFFTWAWNLSLIEVLKSWVIETCKHLRRFDKSFYHLKHVWNVPLYFAIAFGWDVTLCCICMRYLTYELHMSYLHKTGKTLTLRNKVNFAVHIVAVTHILKCVCASGFALPFSQWSKTKSP